MDALIAWHENRIATLTARDQRFDQMLAEATAHGDTGEVQRLDSDLARDDRHLALQDDRVARDRHWVAQVGQAIAHDDATLAADRREAERLDKVVDHRIGVVDGVLATEQANAARADQAWNHRTWAIDSLQQRDDQVQQWIARDEADGNTAGVWKLDEASMRLDREIVATEAARRRDTRWDDGVEQRIARTDVRLSDLDIADRDLGAVIASSY